ncbi:FkbM family methyltransferase [Silvibacterium acidisoli]|uniref:FkbM family methyltransferase n=1 Tax=Acidobacteriaceae bacterium ZG23-2 TaxID=2883246 RepID=UPI00406C26E4
MASSTTSTSVSTSESPFTHESALPARLKLLRWLGKQTWIPRGQDLLLRKIWSPDAGQHFLYEVDFFGLRYRGDLARFIDWVIFAYRSYSYCELCLLDALGKEIRTRRGALHFIDVGANVGQHSLFMSVRADKVYSFEPVKSTCTVLEKQISLNNLSNVLVSPYALGATDEVMKFHAGKSNNSGIGTFVPEPDVEYKDPIDLQIRKGDDLLDEIGCTRVDLLKVDVEGFEEFVFRGLSRHILEDRPAVLSELSDRSREHFGSEEELRKLFWDGAVFADVSGRQGCSYVLKPFRFGETREMLIVPPELGSFVQSRIVH